MATSNEKEVIGEPVAVADVSGEQSKFQRKVLVAVDGSDHSRRAIQFTCENVLGEKDLLVLLNIRQEFDDAEFYSTSSYKEEFDRRYLEGSQALLEQHSNFAKTIKQGLSDDTIRKISAAGDPREKILEEAELVKPVFIVVGSHGRGPVARTFLGSVSDYLVHHAPCPVLVVRPDQKSQALTKSVVPGLSSLGHLVQSA